MAEFVVYTRDGCPFCVQAKELLTQMGHTYVEKNVNDQPEFRDELIEKFPEFKTFPQIYINEYRIGGYSDLKTAVDIGTFSAILSLNL